MTLARPPRHPSRLVYLGTPAVAVPPLVALHGAGFDIALVVTGVDKRRGRGAERSPSPVKAAAIDLGLAVTDRLDDCVVAGADLGVVVAYGRLIPDAVLEVVPMINIHFSLLPRWRGAAPVERALLAGDPRTGVCLMDIASELDTGALYRCRDVDIAPDDTLDSLRARLVDAGSALLVDTLREGLGEPVPQAGEVTYAAKIAPSELRLDLDRPAVELDRVIRLGRAWTTHRGRRLKVLEAAVEPVGPPAGELAGSVVGTGEGGLRLITVQPEGRTPMPVDAWLNGVQLAVGERLG
ncbi:MAG: methionyl-tRNA formyltransferase [Acidimicrobiales bacterium]